MPGKSNKKTSALNHIRVDVATHGRLTKESLRLFVENRISKELLDKIIMEGMRIFERK
jgi:hypothetical protein